MRYLLLIVAVVVLCAPGFASVHAVSRTAKVASYPARHPRKDAHAAKRVAQKTAHSLKFAAKLIF
jgi:hypothetical protein